MGEKEPRLKEITNLHGYPPLWSRKPGFSTLIHIILEQQVSLASAKSAFEKLQAYIGTVTPERLSSLSEAELKACYFSRQKIVYAKHLAEAILTGKINLTALETLPDDEVKRSLQTIKGIGDWTTDVYLMMALNRVDCFPPGDIALVNSFRKVMELPAASKEEIGLVATSWKPYRTIAAYLLWHSYLAERRKKAPGIM